MGFNIEKLNEYLTDNVVKIVKNLEEFTSRQVGYEFEGYQLVTNKGEIMFGICNDQQCCEDWGYDCFIENKAQDEDFIGARILEISQEGMRHDKYENCASPLVIKTTKGDIDLWVYNKHNGYHCHPSLINIFGVFIRRFYV